jgi:hypothetical protein
VAEPIHDGLTTSLRHKRRMRDANPHWAAEQKRAYLQRKARTSPGWLAAYRERQRALHRQTDYRRSERQAWASLRDRIPNDVLQQIEGFHIFAADSPEHTYDFRVYSPGRGWYKETPKDLGDPPITWAA